MLPASAIAPSMNTSAPCRPTTIPRARLTKRTNIFKSPTSSKSARQVKRHCLAPRGTQARKRGRFDGLVLDENLEDVPHPPRAVRLSRKNQPFQFQSCLKLFRLCLARIIKIAKLVCLTERHQEPFLGCESGEA